MYIASNCSSPKQEQVPEYEQLAIASYSTDKPGRDLREQVKVGRQT